MNKQYTFNRTSSIMNRIYRISYNKRKEMFDLLAHRVDFSALNNVLDVGVTADQDHPESNFFEQFYPHKNQITALSNQDAAWLEKEYEGLKFVSGDALALPFADSSFDLVFSSAVIEHVGSFDNQIRYVKECFRVAKRYVFITMPNRWFPVEFHTCLPLIHWLPKTLHRRLLKILGINELSLEENLNLLGESDLIKILSACNMPPPPKN